MPGVLMQHSTGWVLISLSSSLSWYLSSFSASVCIASHTHAGLTLTRTFPSARLLSRRQNVVAPKCLFSPDAVFALAGTLRVFEGRLRGETTVGSLPRPHDTLFSSPSPGIRSRRRVINAPLIRRLQRVLTGALDRLLLAGIDRHVWIVLRSVTLHRERLQFLKVTFFTPVPSCLLGKVYFSSFAFCLNHSINLEMTRLFPHVVKILTIFSLLIYLNTKHLT